MSTLWALLRQAYAQRVQPIPRPRVRFDTDGRWVPGADNPGRYFNPANGRLLKPSFQRAHLVNNILEQVAHLEVFYGVPGQIDLRHQLDAMAAMLGRIEGHYGQGLADQLVVSVLPSLQFATQRCPNLTDPYGGDYLKFLALTAMQFLHNRQTVRVVETKTFSGFSVSGRMFEFVANLPYDLNVVCLAAPFRGYSTEAVLYELARFGGKPKPFAELGFFGLAHMAALVPEACENVCLLAAGDIYHFNGGNRHAAGFYTNKSGVELAYYPTHEPDLMGSAVIAITV